MAGANSAGHDWLDVNSTLAAVTKLQADRKYRDATELFYVEGVRNFVQAVDNHASIEAILFSDRLLIAPLARKLLRAARRAGVPTLRLTPEQFRQVSYAERASGVGAIIRQPWSRLHDVSPRAGLCWIALETVRSPGNLGTLIRTSEAIGGAGFILIGGQIDPFNADVVRASMGALFRQTFVRAGFPALCHWVRRHRCHVLGASPDGTAELHSFDYPRPCLLFLGGERQGLSPQQRDLCQQLVRIPMIGAADSLNLAVAGGLLMYEIYRSTKLGHVLGQKIPADSPNN